MTGGPEHSRVGVRVAMHSKLRGAFSMTPRAISDVDDHDTNEAKARHAAMEKEAQELARDGDARRVVTSVPRGPKL